MLQPVSGLYIVEEFVKSVGIEDGYDKFDKAVHERTGFHHSEHPHRRSFFDLGQGKCSGRIARNHNNLTTICYELLQYRCHESNDLLGHLVSVWNMRFVINIGYGVIGKRLFDSLSDR